MKPIIVSPHAFERVQERKITRAEVEATIRTPDLKEPGKRGKLRARKKFGSRLLDTLYKETDKSIILVTAYWRKA